MEVMDYKDTNSARAETFDGRVTVLYAEKRKVGGVNE